MPSELATAVSPIPLCTPNLAGNELRYVTEAVESGWVSSVGPFVTRFERELAAAVGAREAVAVVNGTAALHVALVLAGVQPDDEVILPALTFIAPANAVRYCGAWPVFLDVERDYLQLDPAAVLAFLERDCQRTPDGLRNRHTGRRVRALIAVDLLGHPADTDLLGDACRAFGLELIEDATESLGAHRRGRTVGSDARFAAFSFNGNKLLTTGGGGMLVTDDPALAARARYLTTQAKDDAVEFIHGEVGWNYRLTNVQAAIGVAQLEQLPGFVDRKRAIRERYAEALAGLPLELLGEAPWAASSQWMVTARLSPAARLDRRQLAEALAAEQIETRPLWQPLHQSPAHRGAWHTACPVAEAAHATALSLPCSTHLTDPDLDRVADAVRRSLA